MKVGDSLTILPLVIRLDNDFCQSFEDETSHGTILNTDNRQCTDKHVILYFYNYFMHVANPYYIY